jgi:hypothetical protein
MAGVELVKWDPEPFNSATTAESVGATVGDDGDATWNWTDPVDP